MAAEVKFVDNRIQVKNAMRDKSLAVLEEVTGEIESQTKRNTRVDSSKVKNSWKHTVRAVGDDYIGTVGSPEENAIWEEFGTGEHALNKDGRKGAWYVPVEGYTGKKKPTYNGKVVIVYGKNKQKFYKTNGKKPSRALHNAWASLKNKVIKHIQNSFKGL
jgi:hypothetical protein